jgi:hypothetical protein
MSSPYYGYGQGGYQYDEQLQAEMLEKQGIIKLKEIENNYKLGKSEVAARLKIASQSSKDARYGVDAQRETELARIAQMRAEMENVGIPRVAIEKWVAEKHYEIAQAEIAIKKEQLGLEKAGLMGYMEQPAALTPAKQARLTQLRARDQQLKDAGYAQGIAYDGPEGAAELAGLEQESQATSRVPTEEARQFNEQLAFDIEEMKRIGIPDMEIRRYVAEKNYEMQQKGYELDVARFGAELASTPDTYFQGRRFQGVDVPRLMGGAGAATTEPMGGPTPGVSTMGAYLSGQDPYGAGAGGGAPAAGGYSAGYTTAPGSVDPNAAANKAAAGGYAPSGAYGGSAVSSAPGQTMVAGGSGGMIDADPNAAGQKAAAGGGGYSADYAMAPGSVDPNAAGARAGAGVNPSQKTIAQIARASPPSPYDGLDDQDTATLKLMESIYKKGGQSIAGGELHRLKASGRFGFLRSAGRLLGYDPAELESSYEAYRPSQDSSRLA